MAVTGWNVAYTAIGLVLIYSGYKGTSLSSTVTDLFQGKLDTDDVEGLTSSTAESDSADTDSTATDSSSNSASQNQALAKAIIELNSGYSGWNTGTEWSDLVALWNQESGWSSTAENSSSGAYGIAQALPATKYPAAGQAPPIGTSDPESQIVWGLSYIADRYGDPVAAWAHETSEGWY